MNELFSTIVKWFGDNGTASDWFTSFGTVGAVVTSLFLTLRQDKVKVATWIEKSRNNYYVIVHNKGKLPVYISNITVQYKSKSEEYITLKDDKLGTLEEVVYSQQPKPIKINNSLSVLQFYKQESQRASTFFLQCLVIVNGRTYKTKEFKVHQ